MRMAVLMPLDCSGTPTACEPADGSRGLGSTYGSGILRPRSHGRKNKVEREMLALLNRNQKG